MAQISVGSLARGTAYGPRAAGLLLAGLLLCAPDRALGDCAWTTSASSINAGPATCNVGIGLDPVTPPTTPNFPITVRRNAPGNVQVRIISNSTNLYLGAEWLHNAPGIGTNNANPLSLNTNNVSRLFIDASGNVGIGTISPSANLNVVGNGVFTGSVTAANIAAHYQDIAEWVPSRETLEPGVVVVLDRREINHVVASTSPYDTAVAGVVSAEPGLILGAEGTGRVKVATTGRVKVRVDATRAPIAVGDLLVSGEKPGVAMRSEAVELAGIKIHRPGTVIGKALEPLAGGSGEILVLLTLQ
jgi:hypothetical protein